MVEARPWVGVGAGTATVAAGRLDGWCAVTVAHALVHGIRGTVGNRLFRLYVGQEWLSPAALSTEPKTTKKSSTEPPPSPVSVTLSALTSCGLKPGGQTGRRATYRKKNGCNERMQRRQRLFY